ncbi:MAG TPA: hypothetical protein VKM72_01020 [Thermoanaerobaculia bacterium]|nr:hypothetical protein [Thermoanaerobaculia bacterium]
MSRYDADHLYRLLPAVYRQRDEEADPTSGQFALRELVEILAGQAQVVERDIARLYDDWFIETCEPWVVPYLGDLIGVRATHATRVSRRAEVANTLAYRRAKGTLAVLELLARDTTGWPARAAEMFERLSTTQHLNHVRPQSLRTPDLRRVTSLEHLGGPFEDAAHAAEVRRIAVEQGKYNIRNVALFLWRLGSYRLDGVTPREDPGSGGLRFTFNPLGRDEPLFYRPETEESGAHLAEERHVPGPIRRRGLHEAIETLVGPDGSLNLFTVEPDGARRSLPHRPIAADLRTWNRPLPAGVVAIDPVLGRIAFPAGEAPSSPLRATYQYGFSDDLGGGPYEREATFTRVAGERVIQVPQDFATLAAAVAEWGQSGSAVIVINDSATYDLGVDVTLEVDARLEIRAANEQRPTLRLTADLRVAGGAGSEVELNGLLIAGRPVEARGQLERLHVRHCTLAPLEPVNASLVIRSEEIDVVVERSILGPVRAAAEARVEIRDSIVDAGSREAVAFSGLDGAAEDGALTLSRVTVVGAVRARELPLVENSLLLGIAAAARRQAGCVRFSWIPPGSRVPRRFHCQPSEEASASEALRLAPRFTSLRYGQPGYGQLRRDTPGEVRRGAEDESEMGAFSSLKQPQREDDLRVRLDEYLRVGLEAGFFFVT